MKKFTTSEALKYGWLKTMEHMNFFIVFLLFALALAIIVRAFIFGTSFTQLLGHILSFIFEIMISIGIVRTVIKITNNERPTFRDFFLRDDKVVFNYIVGLILYICIVVVGLALLVIPGIILAIRLKFFSFYIIDERMDPISALKRSFEVTRGSTLNLLFLNVVIALINALAIFLLGIGLIITIPLSAIAVGHVYRKLKN